jgi:hypothetical protein
VTNGNQAPQSVPICNGAAGADGAQGATGATGAQGADGAQGATGATGAQGADGAQGATGATGAQGQQGAQGLAGASAMGIVQLIAPCGGTSSGWREELILLTDGSLLSDFSDLGSNGKNTRLALITDGTFVTTDGSGCTFTVQTSGQTRTLTWSDGSSSHASWTAGGYSWSLPVSVSGATPL